MDEFGFGFGGRKTTLQRLTTIRTRLCLAYLSLSNTGLISVLFGVDSVESTYHNWVYEADRRTEAGYREPRRRRRDDSSGRRQTVPATRFRRPRIKRVDANEARTDQLPLEFQRNCAKNTTGKRLENYTAVVEDTRMDGVLRTLRSLRMVPHN